MKEINFNPLIGYLKKIPAIDSEIATGMYEDKNWWVKFQIDIKHELAWHVVQELGHVVNYISIDERLPAAFYPVSAPPYLNGGPDEFLYWIIESKEKDFAPGKLKEWLEGRLPNPVDDLEQWADDDDDDEDE